jgi:hypothetical protein
MIMAANEKAEGIAGHGAEGRPCPGREQLQRARCDECPHPEQQKNTGYQQSDDEQGFQQGDGEDQQVGDMGVLRYPGEQLLQQAVHGNRNQLRVLNTCAAASRVASITLSLWVDETNPASKADGARYTPACSMP